MRNCNIAQNLGDAPPNVRRASTGSSGSATPVTVRGAVERAQSAPLGTASSAKNKCNEIRQYLWEKFPAKLVSRRIGQHNSQIRNLTHAEQAPKCSTSDGWQQACANGNGFGQFWRPGPVLSPTKFWRIWSSRKTCCAWPWIFGSVWNCVLKHKAASIKQIKCYSQNCSSLLSVGNNFVSFCRLLWNKHFNVKFLFISFFGHPL